MEESSMNEDPQNQETFLISMKATPDSLDPISKRANKQAAVSTKKLPQRKNFKDPEMM